MEDAPTIWLQRKSLPETPSIGANGSGRDEDWIRRAALDDEARFLLLYNLMAPLSAGRNAGLSWASRADLDKLGLETEPVLLGLLDGVAHFAVDVSALDDPTSALENLNGADFQDARSAALMMSSAEAGILCQAAAQLNWHASHRSAPPAATGRRSAGAGSCASAPTATSSIFPAPTLS